MSTFKRVYDILNLFNADTPHLSVSEVAQTLNLDRTTVHRLMSDLYAKNVLVKSNETKKYSPGVKLFEWGKVFLSTIDLKTIAMPYLQELNQKTTEQVMIHIVKDDKRFVLVNVESLQPVRHVIDPEFLYGPLHAGAPGKLLLAYLPEEKRKAIIENSQLRSYTSKTIIDKDALLRELEEVRRKGVAISVGEQHEALWAVSGPIRKYTGEVIASLTIGSLMMQHNAEREKEYITLLKRTASRISQDLGYQGKLK